MRYDQMWTMDRNGYDNMAVILQSMMYGRVTERIVDSYVSFHAYCIEQSLLSLAFTSDTIINYYTTATIS